MKRSSFIFIVLMGLVACGTSPEPDFYTLTAVSGSVFPDVVTTVKVRQPSLAAYLDRPDFVQQKGDRITIDEMKRWAAPTDRMFADILAEDLQQRLPASTIITEVMPQSEPVRFVVDVNLQQFNAIEAGHVALTGNFILNDKQGSSLPPQPLALTMNTGWSTGGGVAGLSDLTAQLADTISSQLADRLKPQQNEAH